MKLHLSNTDDGYMIWRASFSGRRNDGDGGLDIYEEWFTVACTESMARDILDVLVTRKRNQYTGWHTEPSVEYKAMSPMEFVVCSRHPNGDLNAVQLTDALGFSITPAIMDTRN